jgi:signal transduction histidine kinase
VVLGGTEPNQFTEDDIRTLKKFTEAISVGYKRFLDFQELDRRNRELQETQLQLIQSEKMASLGELVAGVAHELNTPIGAIKSNTQIAANALTLIQSSLDSYFDSDASKKQLLKVLRQLETLNQVDRRATQRMTKIIDSLRSFSRLDEAEWKLTDVHVGIDDTLILIQHKLGDRIRVVKEYGDLPAITCYPRQLNQMFMILIANAVEAIESEGEIKIQTSTEDRNAIIKITDTGRGIPPELQRRVFDPGFTTKGVGVGTGLGLSICYQIVTEHRGRIEVDSQVGSGSSFTVTLPLHQDPT